VEGEGDVAGEDEEGLREAGGQVVSELAGNYAVFEVQAIFL
jgi:hypothetical protein